MIIHPTSVLVVQKQIPRLITLVIGLVPKLPMLNPMASVTCHLSGPSYYKRPACPVPYVRSPPLRDCTPISVTGLTLAISILSIDTFSPRDTSIASSSLQFATSKLMFES